MRKLRQNSTTSLLTETLVQLEVVKFKSAFTSRDKGAQAESHESMILDWKFWNGKRWGVMVLNELNVVRKNKYF